MKIGIIGSGHIGGTLARLFVGAGRTVAISNSRGPESLTKLIDSLGPAARAVETTAAVEFGELVVLAIPLRVFQDLPTGSFKGKVVVDAMNYYAERDGHIADLDSGAITSSELVAQHLPDARVIKAFNTIHYKHLDANGSTEKLIPDRQAILVAGDDAEAKSIVSGLIEDIGFAPIDTGSLHEGGRCQQPESPLYNHRMTGREAAAAVKQRALNLPSKQKD